MAQWNPLHDLLSLQDQMNRLFEDATQRRTGEADIRDELEHADWSPNADVYESEDGYTVALDLPGIDRATLDISIDENRLTIKGNRPGADTVRQSTECPRGTFLRSFRVPGKVDQAKIKADYKDGVLTVHLPKMAEQKPQRVQIKVV